MSFSKFVLPSLYFQNLRRCETFEHFFVIFEKKNISVNLKVKKMVNNILEFPYQKFQFLIVLTGILLNMCARNIAEQRRFRNRHMIPMFIQTPWVTAHPSCCPSAILHIRPTATSELRQLFIFVLFEGQVRLREFPGRALRLGRAIYFIIKNGMICINTFLNSFI